MCAICQAYHQYARGLADPVERAIGIQPGSSNPVIPFGCANAFFPNNGNWLSTNASAQNLTKDPQQPAAKNQLEQFKEQLQRAVLGRVASSVSGALFDEANRTWIEDTQTFGDCFAVAFLYGDRQIGPRRGGAGE